jgi:hypothetical protein
MRRLILGALVCATLSLPSYAMTGREIMDKVNQQPTPKSGRSALIMRVTKGSEVAEKEFTVEARKYGDKENKILVTFIKPTQIVLLTHTHKDREDDQWLKMSSGGVKRIASSSKGKSFVNSHYSYEDLTSRNIDDYKYDLAGEVKVGNDDCYKIETTRIKGSDSYEKVTQYVRKADYFIVKAEFYQKGKILKTLENSDIKAVSGIMTPFKAVMTEIATGDKTELMVKSVDYNINIPDAKLKKESLD